MDVGDARLGQLPQAAGPCGTLLSKGEVLAAKLLRYRHVVGTGGDWGAWYAQKKTTKKCLDVLCNALHLKAGWHNNSFSGDCLLLVIFKPLLLHGKTHTTAIHAVSMSQH